VPTSYYGMSLLLDRPVYWVGEPGLVVNMNVSWRECLLLWRLVRLPELFDWVEREGMGGLALDRYRANHALEAASLVRDVYFSASEETRSGFDIEQYIARTLHLRAFRTHQIPRLRRVYEEAQQAGRLKPTDPLPEQLFAGFGL
jgi:hypothetical protein